MRTSVSPLSCMSPAQFVQFDINKSVETANVDSDNLVIVAVVMFVLVLVGVGVASCNWEHSRHCRKELEDNSSFIFTRS